MVREQDIEWVCHVSCRVRAVAAGVAGGGEVTNGTSANPPETTLAVRSQSPGTVDVVASEGVPQFNCHWAPFRY